MAILLKYVGGSGDGELTPYGNKRTADNPPPWGFYYVRHEGSDQPEISQASIYRLSGTHKQGEDTIWEFSISHDGSQNDAARWMYDHVSDDPNFW